MLQLTILTLQLGPYYIQLPLECQHRFLSLPGGFVRKDNVVFEVSLIAGGPSGIP